MSNGYTTIQRRHSDKWLARITAVRVFTLENHFSGAECPVSALRFAIERLGENLQIAKDGLRGQLHRHGNHWYEFDLKAEG